MFQAMMWTRFNVLATNAAQRKIRLLSKKEMTRLNVSGYVLWLQIVDVVSKPKIVLIF